MFRLSKRPKHTPQDLFHLTGVVVLPVLPSGVYKSFQAGVVLSHCTQYPRNPVVRLLPTTPMNHQGNLLSTSSLSVLGLVTCESNYRPNQERHRNVVIVINEAQYATGKVSCSELSMIFLPLI